MKNLIRLLSIHLLAMGGLLPAAGAPEAVQDKEKKVISVLPLFTEEAYNYGERHTDPFFEANRFITFGNKVLDNSGLENVQLYLLRPKVSAKKALAFHRDKDSTAPKSVLADLGSIGNNLDHFENLRKQYGADIVVVFSCDNTKGSTNGASFGAMAPSGESEPVFEPINRYVCMRIDLVGDAESTLIHEIGHLAGCGHSDDQAGMDGAESGPQTLPYSCGYHGVDADYGPYRTVMAYDFKHEDEFSGDFASPLPHYNFLKNPTFSGPVPVNCGEGGTFPVGDKEKHDNTRVFRNFAHVLASQTAPGPRTMKNDDFQNAYSISEADLMPGGNHVYKLFAYLRTATRGEGDPALPAAGGSGTDPQGEYEFTVERNGRQTVWVQAYKTVWFKYTAERDGNLRFRIPGTTRYFATALSGDTPDSLVPKAAVSGHPNHSVWSKQVHLKAGETLYICVDSLKHKNDEEDQPYEKRCLMPFQTVYQTPLIVEFSPAPTKEWGWSALLFAFLCGASFIGAIACFWRRKPAKAPDTPRDKNKDKKGEGRTQVMPRQGKPVEKGPFTNSAVPFNGVANVRVYYPDGTIENHVITGETVVGRGENCKPVIDDKSVSTVHAHISFRDGLLLLKDLGSTNGICCPSPDGKAPLVLRKGETVGVRRGDSVYLGDVRLEFR